MRACYACMYGHKLHISRVPDWNSISQACYIVKIHHSGPEPSICVCVFVLAFMYAHKLHICCMCFECSVFVYVCECAHMDAQKLHM